MKELILNMGKYFYIRGTAAAVYGVGILIWPGLTYKVMAVSLGLFLVLWSVLALVVGFSAYAGDSYPIKTEGVVGLPIALLILLGPAIGISGLIDPSIPATILLYLVLGWVLLAGITQLLEGIALWKEADREWLLIACGLLSLICAYLLFAQRDRVAVETAWLIGYYLITFGVLHILMTYRVLKSA